MILHQKPKFLTAIVRIYTIAKTSIACMPKSAVTSQRFMHLFQLQQTGILAQNSSDLMLNRSDTIRAFLIKRSPVPSRLMISLSSRTCKAFQPQPSVPY